MALLPPLRAGGIAHGVESSCAAIVSSILASPPRSVRDIRIRT
jgi:hypothetical protein